MSALHTAALRRALHERDLYRAMALAGLDQLHEAQRELDMLREKRERVTVAELHEERARYAREVFGRTPADEPAD